MPDVDVVVSCDVEPSIRVRSLSGMFDCPIEEKQTKRWQFDAPFDEEPWSIGLIVGPSGCGKTLVLTSLFGEPYSPCWGNGAVIDDFPASKGVDDIAAVCRAVGFNTIPAWMRPFRVLSNGEQFRATIARLLVEASCDSTNIAGKPVVVDEFTSVVDRQVAKATSHAVQKFVRRAGQQMVVASCHYDIIDWLQPDWIIEPAEGTFRRRRLRSRPQLDIEVGRVPYAAWHLFAPFHYLSASLNRSARCFGLWVEGELAAFSSVLHRPHPRVNNIRALSRTVVLPDYQGLGLAPVLTEKLARCYTAFGYRFRSYPAHPHYIRIRDRSPDWLLVKKPGHYSPMGGCTSKVGGFGGRPCAVFEYVGDAAPHEEASALLGSFVVDRSV